MNEKLMKHPLILIWHQHRRDEIYDVELTKRIRLMNFNELLDDCKKHLLVEIEEYDE